MPSLLINLCKYTTIPSYYTASWCTASPPGSEWKQPQHFNVLTDTLPSRGPVVLWWQGFWWWAFCGTLVVILQRVAFRQQSISMQFFLKHTVRGHHGIIMVIATHVSRTAVWSCHMLCTHTLYLHVALSREGVTYMYTVVHVHVYTCTCGISRTSSRLLCRDRAREICSRLQKDTPRATESVSSPLHIVPYTHIYMQIC